MGSLAYKSVERIKISLVPFHAIIAFCPGSNIGGGSTWCPYRDASSVG